MAVASIDERRNHVHGMWAAVAPSWNEYADEVDERGAAMTERILQLAEIGPGDRVLELACGPGGAGLAAAAEVGDGGHVVVSDIVTEMVAIAEARGKTRGLRNVTAVTLDIEAIDQPDSEFDSVICREGLMFAVEPAQALREVHRVLKPGGRFAFSVWGPREANPWLGVVLDAVAAVTGLVVPPPGMPGPFALSDSSALLALMEGSAFEGVAIEPLVVNLRAPSFDLWWRRTAAVAGPVARLIAGLEDTRRAELERHLRDGTSRYATGAGLDIPGLALIGHGRRSEA